MKKIRLSKYMKWSLIVVLLLLCFRPHDNVFDLCRAGIEIMRQKSSIRKYKTRISELERQYESMSTDRDTLEKFARERFYFAEPGDDVYVIE